MGGMRRMGAVALAAVLGVSLVACGGSDDAGNDEAKGATTTTKESKPDTTDLDLGDFTGECREFTQAFAGAGAAIGSAFSGGSKDDIEQVAEYFSEVADQVPDEIRADFEVFAEAYSEFAQVLADADIDFSDPSQMDPETMSQLEALGEAFSAPEVEEASANISAYVEANCQGG